MTRLNGGGGEGPDAKEAERAHSTLKALCVHASLKSEMGRKKKERKKTERKTKHL